MSTPPIVMTFARIEGQHLADLIDQFQQLLTDEDAHDDIAVQRLTPDVYPDDREASAEFAALTQGDLRDRRTHDARTVLAGLHAFVDDDNAARGDDAVEVTVALDDVDAWMRTLAALRLVLASRLGIEKESDHTPNDPHFGVYDWLGYRLELLIEAADDADEATSSRNLDQR